MSEQYGLLVTCDRCGESIFLKEGEYEDTLSLPGAWSRAQFSEIYITSPAFYTLCPRCAKLFKKHRDDFFDIGEKPMIKETEE